jgi:hypothetical protein
VKQKHDALLVLYVHLYKYMYIIAFVLSTVDVIYLTTDVKMYANDGKDKNVRLLVFLRISDNRDCIVFFSVEDNQCDFKLIFAIV